MARLRVRIAPVFRLCNRKRRGFRWDFGRWQWRKHAPSHSRGTFMPGLYL